MAHAVMPRVYEFVHHGVMKSVMEGGIQEVIRYEECDAVQWEPSGQRGQIEGHYEDCE